MKSLLWLASAVVSVFVILLLLHLPLLRLPYFWDEAGYYVPAALDFFRHGLLIPRDTLPTGHTPLVSVYLAGAWRLFGFAPLVTRSAMVLVAAATVVTTYALGRLIAGRAVGIWAAVLLALSPLFFAQSSLVFLDLTAALFTTLAVLFVLEGRWGMFALAACLAVLSKETAVVALLPVWAYAAFRRKERSRKVWLLSAIPLVPLIAWALFYHARTGFWTGNSTYLQYNLYAALTPLHILRSLVARLAELLFQGFKWLLALGALAGLWMARRAHRDAGTRRRDGGAQWRSGLATVIPAEAGIQFADPILSLRGHGQASDIQADSPTQPCIVGSQPGHERRFRDFCFLALGLAAVYVVMLSLVGGAILPRYMLPVFPAFFVLLVAWIARLPAREGKVLCVVVAACFVAGWFINPPYPFPYEDNVSYADFVRLHQRAAKYLESLPGDPVILTAWPATNELTQPFLGYVSKPLRVQPVQDFTPGSFAHVHGFNVLYLYSLKWNPPLNLISGTLLRRFSRRFYSYVPPAAPQALVSRFHLTLLQSFSDRGQWVRIYATGRGAAMAVLTRKTARKRHHRPTCDRSIGR